MLIVGIVAFCIHVALVWWFRFPPMSDYPDWLLQANILAHYHDPGFDYVTWYKLILSPVPNLGFIAPTGLLAFVMPVETAGKVVLTLYMIGFVIAFRKYLLACGAPTALWLLGVLLIYNISFQNGNIGFLLGVCGLLILIARDLKPGGPDQRPIALNLVWVLLLFLAHALPAFVYFFYLLIRILGRTTTRQMRKDYAARAIVLLVLAGVYLVTRPHESILQPFSFEPGWRYRLSTLTKSFVGSWAFPPYEFSILRSLANLAMFALVGYLAFTALRSRELWKTEHGKLAVLVIALAIVAPKSVAGIGESTQRLSLIGFMLLAGFTGSLNIRNTALSLFVGALLLFVTAVRIRDYSEAGRYLEDRFEFVSRHVPPSVPILSMNDQLGSERPFFPELVPKGSSLIHQNDYLLLRGGFNPWSYRTGICIPRLDLIHTLDSLQHARHEAGLNVLRGSDIPPAINWIVIDATTSWGNTIISQLKPEFILEGESPVRSTLHSAILRRISKPY